MYTIFKDAASAGFKYFRWQRKHKEETPGRELCSRVLRVFAAQDIAPQQISRLLPHEFGISPSVFLSNEDMSKALTEPILAHVCETTGVWRAWVDGVDDFVYPACHAYKNLGNAIRLFAELSKQHEHLQFHVVKDKDLNLSAYSTAAPMLIFVRGEVTNLDDIRLWKETVIADQWLQYCGGIAVWGSLDLSDPSREWFTPARLTDGTLPSPPHWSAPNKPKRIVTNIDQVFVVAHREADRIRIAVRRGSYGLRWKLTDASSARLRKAVAKAGPTAVHVFEGDHAVIHVEASRTPLADWLREHPNAGP